MKVIILALYDIYKKQLSLIQIIQTRSKKLEKLCNITLHLSENSDKPKIINSFRYSLQRWKQALEVFLKLDKISQRPDHEICYFIGRLCWFYFILFLIFAYKLQFFILFLGELLYRNYKKVRPNAVDEAKEYFQRAIQNGKQIESYSELAHIYKAENNLTKAIEMLENTLQLIFDNKIYQLFFLINFILVYC